MVETNGILEILMMLPAEKNRLGESGEFQEVFNRMPERKEDLVETEEILDVLAGDSAAYLRMSSHLISGSIIT